MDDRRGNLLTGIIFLFFGSLFTTFFTYVLQMTPIRLMLTLWMESPLSPILNFVPVFLLMLGLFFLTNQLGLSFSLGSAMVLFLSYVHSQKILIRQEPLVPSDTFVIREGVEMIKEGGFGLSLKLGIALILCLILAIVLILSLRDIKLSPKVRIGGLITVVFVFGILISTVYSDEELYNGFPRLTEEETNIAQSFRDKGFVYCFLYHRNTNKVEKPEEYREEYARLPERDFTYRPQGIKPHVVMIMGEAWSDIHRSERISFKEGTDPFTYTDPIMDQSLIRGTIIVPSYGGGTSNTEYDTLTGNSTLFHSTNIFSPYKALHSEKKSIVDVFNKNGYDTVGIHPGEPWFYNRQNVYEYLGFDSSFFKDDFKDGELKGGYVSEKEMTRFIKHRFEERDPSSRPLFEFGVTIQNHSPYGVEKYGYTPDTFNGEFSPAVKENLEGYFVGIRDMDLQIKELTDYFNTIDEPILFVYYGDHLPYLVPDFQDLRELGYSITPGKAEGIYPVYQIPYFIWGNRAYRSLIPEWEENPATTDVISASYLGPLVLKAAGIDGTDPYYSYYNRLRQKMPVIFPYFTGIVKEGEYRFRKWGDLSEEYRRIGDIYKSINYETFFMKD